MRFWIAASFFLTSGADAFTQPYHHSRSAASRDSYVLPRIGATLERLSSLDASNSSIPNDNEVREIYKEWCSNQGIPFEEQRLEIFAYNYLLAANHAKKSGFELNLNEFADLTPGEFQYLRQSGGKRSDIKPINPGLSVQTNDPPSSPVLSSPPSQAGTDSFFSYGQGPPGAGTQSQQPPTPIAAQPSATSSSPTGPASFMSSLSSGTPNQTQGSTVPPQPAASTPPWGQAPPPPTKPAASTTPSAPAGSSSPPWAQNSPLSQPAASTTPKAPVSSSAAPWGQNSTPSSQTTPMSQQSPAFPTSPAGPMSSTSSFSGSTPPTGTTSSSPFSGATASKNPASSSPFSGATPQAGPTSSSPFSGASPQAGPTSSSPFSGATPQAGPTTSSPFSGASPQTGPTSSSPFGATQPPGQTGTSPFGASPSTGQTDASPFGAAPPTGSNSMSNTSPFGATPPAGTATGSFGSSPPTGPQSSVSANTFSGAPNQTQTASSSPFPGQPGPPQSSTPQTAPAFPQSQVPQHAPSQPSVPSFSQTPPQQSGIPSTQKNPNLRQSQVPQPNGSAFPQAQATPPQFQPQQNAPGFPPSQATPPSMVPAQPQTQVPQQQSQPQARAPWPNPQARGPQQSQVSTSASQQPSGRPQSSNESINQFTHMASKSSYGQYSGTFDEQAQPYSTYKSPYEVSSETRSAGFLARLRKKAEPNLPLSAFGKARASGNPSAAGGGMGSTIPASGGATAADSGTGWTKRPVAPTGKGNMNSDQSVGSAQHSVPYNQSYSSAISKKSAGTSSGLFYMDTHNKNVKAPLKQDKPAYDKMTSPTGRNPNDEPFVSEMLLLGPQNEKVLIEWLAKKKAERLGIDYSRIQGSGPKGRITLADINAVASGSP